jgi:phospholipid transport system substrate-binding protein
MLARLCVVFYLLLISSIANAVDYSTPMGRVQDSVEQIIGVLRSDDLSREQRWALVAEVIDNSFDFRSMSQSVLSTSWRRASLEERERFIEFFSQYIENTYRSKIEAYTNQKVIYGKETIRGDRAVVETVIVTDSTKIPVSYRLKNNQGDWYAYDVVIEGVSLVNNYRNTFSAIAKNEGMEGLLSDIQRRIDNYKAAESTQNSGSAEIK